uniref:ATP-dependent Clp protease adaptor protein ClpS n=1 Tax=Celosia cristata TaxID=124768 RepID=Q0E5Q6_9CARY|nr:ATP-dependent Clp protease adaptor protein ClpS [Celosia cristata]
MAGAGYRPSNGCLQSRARSRSVAGGRGASETGSVSPHASSPAPVEVDRPTGEEVVEPDRPWIVLVWNDPINLMSYVVFVFQKLFGYSREKATSLMLDVHHKGRAVVSSGTREKAELDVFRLHEHGLWATLQLDT